MHVLLTGSSRWLGRFLAPRLRAAGHRVSGLDIAEGPDTDHIGSVADPTVVRAVFDRGVDAVIHAAALHKPDIARYPEQAFINVNVTGTLNLLSAAAAAGHDRTSGILLTTTTSASRGRHGLQAAEKLTSVPAGTALRAAAEPQVPVKVHRSSAVLAVASAGQPARRHRYRHRGRPPMHGGRPRCRYSR